MLPEALENSSGRLIARPPHIPQDVFPVVLERLQRIMRLRRDLGINLPGIAACWISRTN